MGDHDRDDELEAFSRDLRSAFPARPLANEGLHLAAIVEASHLLTDKGDPVARPGSNADAPAPQVSRLPKPRRNRMKDGSKIPLLAKLSAALLAVFTVTGGVAYAGGLPDPLQDAAATVSGWVGLDLPGADDDTTEELPEVDDVEDATDDTATDDADEVETEDDADEDTDADEAEVEDDATEDGDDQGEDADEVETEDDADEDTDADEAETDDDRSGSNSGSDDAEDDRSGSDSGSDSDDDAGSGSDDSGSDDSDSGSSGSGSDED